MAEEERKTTEEEEVTVSEVSGDHGGNPYHEPAGSPKGGEFAEAPKSGDGSGEEGGEKKSLAESLRERMKQRKAGMTLSERLRAETQQMDVLKQRRRDMEENDHKNIPTLKNFPTIREQYYKASEVYVDITREEYEELKRHIDPIIKNSMLASKFDFYNINKMIDSDEFKNQFGIGKPGHYSVGNGAGFNTTDPFNSRAGVSANSFGAEGVYGRATIGVSEQELWERRCKLEKYGCLLDNNPYSAIVNPELSNSNHYGDAIWILNDNVKKRATFTIGDSLGYGDSEPHKARGRSGIPSLINDGLQFCQCQNISKSRMLKLLRSKKAGDLIDAFGCSYIEAQLHGNIKISRDIYGCSARYDSWNSPEGRKALERLHKMGVKTFTRRTGYSYLEEIIINPETGQYEYRRVE